MVEKSPGRVDEDLVPPPVASPEEEAAVGAEAVHGLEKKNKIKIGEIRFSARFLTLYPP